MREQQAALDLVQDAMLRLAEKYGDRPAAELPMLFQRILQNAIRDWFRRQRVRGVWMTFFSSLLPGDDDGTRDPTDWLPGAEPAGTAPHEQLERSQLVEIIEQEISKLPGRQREAFLMRYWEELDVADTARAMGCSEGSVKTHCARAVQALSLALKARGITL